MKLTELCPAVCRTEKRLFSICLRLKQSVICSNLLLSCVFKGVNRMCFSFPFCLEPQKQRHRYEYLSIFMLKWL